MAGAVSNTAHQLFMISGTLLWGLYESTGAARLAEMLVPEHTRQAAFSLFVGLRADGSPKDADFFKIHAQALQPRSFLGWLAMSAFLLCASSWAAAATAVVLCLSIGAMNVLLFISVIGGVTLGIALGCASVMLFLCACVAGSTAFGCAIVYSTLASTKAVVQTAQRLLLGPPPQGQLHLQGALPPVLEEPEEEESATSAAIEDAPPQQVEDAVIFQDVPQQRQAPASDAADSKRLRDDSDPGASLPPSSSTGSLFTTPTKKKRRNGGSASEVTPAASNTSASTNAPDLLELMTDGFVGSPEGRSPAHSRPATPQAPTLIAA